LIETPLKMEQVQPNSIDLTLADGWKEIDLGNGYVIDPAKPVRYRSGAITRKATGGKTALRVVIIPFQFGNAFGQRHFVADVFTVINTVSQLGVDFFIKFHIDFLYLKVSVKNRICYTRCS